MIDGTTGDDFQPLDEGGGAGPPVRFDHRYDYVMPGICKPPALFEHCVRPCRHRARLRALRGAGPLLMASSSHCRLRPASRARCSARARSPSAHRGSRGRAAGSSSSRGREPSARRVRVRLGHPWHLEQRVGRADVGVEARCGCRDGIRGNLAGIHAFACRNRRLSILYGCHEVGVVRTQVRATGSATVVPIASRGRPRLEPLRQGDPRRHR